jgi:predicted dienelactone hydrolase
VSAMRSSRAPGAEFQFDVHTRSWNSRHVGNGGSLAGDASKAAWARITDRIGDALRSRFHSFAPMCAQVNAEWWRLGGQLRYTSRMLKRTRSAVLSVLIMLLFSSGNCARVSADAMFKVGVTSRHFLPAEPYDWRGTANHAVFEVVWYPADTGADAKPQRIPPYGPALFEAAPAALNAKIATNPAKFPLILLSHGTGGSAQSMAWFATALASRGFIVAGVNHPGNNALQAYTVQGFVLWWKRAQDISAMLDDLLADDEFGPHIDAQRIGAAGFSLGGYTVIELAGGITSRLQFSEACKTPPDQSSCKPPPEFPDLLAKADALTATDPSFAKALRGDGGSYRDPRIRAVFAMAPALGPAVTPESLKSIAIPVAIVAGESDSVVPINVNAKRYAAEIPHAELMIFTGAVGHYTFLDVCTEVGRSTMALLCVDQPGVDREVIHNATIERASKFFDGELSAH